jgi:hypothetical protein
LEYYYKTFENVKILSTTENGLFTGTKTALSQYLKSENTHGFIAIPR